MSHGARETPARRTRVGADGSDVAELFARWRAGRWSGRAMRRAVARALRDGRPMERWIAVCGEALDRLLRARRVDPEIRTLVARAFTELATGFDLAARVRRRGGRRNVESGGILDPVTGLPLLHVLVEEALPRLLLRHARSGRRIAALDVDVVALGAINAEHGRRVGDAVLREVAARLRRVIRAGDPLARGLGDRILCIVTGIEEEATAARVARRILRAMAEPVVVDGRVLRVGVHVGVALHPDHAEGAEDLLACAELALREAKREGGRGVHLYAPATAAAARRHYRLVGELREALAEDRFVLHFQPQVDLLTGRVVGLEALVRWRHPERGLVPPLDFLPALEAAGLAVPLGERVLIEACRTLRRLDHRRLPPLRVAVNLGPAMVRHPDLARFVLDLLAREGLPPERLELEITENVLLDERSEMVREWIDVLGARGIRIALDDFGTGYASLVHLKRFPVHRVKIDRSFVRDIERDPSDCAIIRAILGLASGLGLEVVAEGVETETQRRFLQTHGCRLAQGYLFAPPLEEGELVAFLRTRPCVDGRIARPAALLPRGVGARPGP